MPFVWTDLPGFSTVDGYPEGYLGGSGHAGTLPMHDGWRLPKRHFNPGFEGANPGPSHDETKPRYRVPYRKEKL
jgi:hypothetical protein